MELPTAHRLALSSDRHRFTSLPRGQQAVHLSQRRLALPLLELPGHDAHRSIPACAAVIVPHLLEVHLLMCAETPALGSWPIFVPDSHRLAILARRMSRSRDGGGSGAQQNARPEGKPV